MALTLLGTAFDRVGVVGSGNIGPDIALHFATSLAPHGVKVVVVDIAEEALGRGRARLEKKVDKTAARGKLKPEKAEAIKGAVTFTTEFQQLAGAQLVVEAATEDLAVKKKIFAQLESLLGPEAVLATNTSHLEPEVIFDELAHPGRSVVAHYFFPAERNPIVELVTWDQTDPAVLRLLEMLYEQTGKIPIRVSSRFGFAVNPIFEGMFQAAAQLVEAGVADPIVVDAVAQKALGYGVGPFTAMNLCGGNPLTNKALPDYGERVMPWFRSPQILQEATEKGEVWPTAGRGETVEVDANVEETVSKALLGAFFGLVTEVVDAGIIDVGSLELAVSTALAVRPPFAHMNRVGVDEALRLVEAYAETQEGFRVPELLRQQATSGRPWAIPVVSRRDEGDIAVITIRRPAALNALNTAVFDQLEAHFQAIGQDGKIRGAVVTGFGTRAFVAGADIKELSRIEGVEALSAKSARGQEVFAGIQNLGKPVVAAMNGLAFGGGLELTLACTARIARQGQRVFAGQPEPKLGVIPGYGGTQRLPRIVGLEAAWPLLRHGQPISSAEAVEIGLITKEVEAGSLVDEALALCRELDAGDAPVLPSEPIPVPDNLPDVDLGHLSRKTDEIMQRVVLEGARTTLDEGLRLEHEAFGQCYETKDFHIGIQNFLNHGAKKDAEFVHA